MEKITQFAQRHRTTAKTLRHYDRLGLLKPGQTDAWTGYRFYGEEQERYLQWILLLKNVGLSLAEIKLVLDAPAEAARLLALLKGKRVEIHNRLDAEITRSVQIDKLIDCIEREGFDMGKTIDLMAVSGADVRHIIKNMPNYMSFLEQVEDMVAQNPGKTVVLAQGDLWHMKAINDNYGMEAGDRAIAAFYDAIKSRLPQGVCARDEADAFFGAFVAEKDEAEEVVQGIIDDFAGCKIQGVPAEALGCRFGCVAGVMAAQDLRPRIEQAREVTLEAARQGKNKFVIQDV